MAERQPLEILPLLLAAVAPAAAGQRPVPNDLRLAALSDIADFTESLKQLSDVIQGINTFLSGAAFISETIGFSTILLFLAVLLFSAGFSALGMPRGKASFISSLVTADALWISWKVIFNTPLTDYLGPMIKSNLIVLCPLLAVTIISRAAPLLGRRIGSVISSLFNRRRRIGTSNAAALFGEYRERCARLDGSILEDIAAAGQTGSSVILSGETRKSAEELKKTLDSIERASR